MSIGVGPVEVTIARRERILLAALLLHANREVSQERLVDAIWGDRPPAGSAGQVHSSVYRLRRQLAAAGAPDGLIVTHPTGYQARVESQGLDLTEFRGLRDQARAAAANGSLAEARAHYRAALELWRGPALDGIGSDGIRQAAAALDEEHHQAVEECIETELSLGLGGEMVAELTDLVRQHPHREGLHRALMLALYRAGRQADALAAFRHARQLLHDELGIEPGVELQRLHQEILNGEASLDGPSTTPRPASASRSTVPRALPADVVGFTGRSDAMKALDELLIDPQDGSPAPVVISAIAGTAGIGKTALAVHWAHHVAERFPDGQLYVNLRGYDPDQPVAPADALARFLVALGVAGQDIPLDLEERAARFRSEVAGRRMLVVLDNAAAVEQVRPLLPGSGSCTVVATSRDSLVGLVAVDGARRLDLDLLPLGDAVTLLRRLIGARVDAEPEAAGALAELCVRLPLALRVAAELAASRPRVPLADLVDELSDRQRRLELLDGGGDPHAAVQVVFSWSIRRLPPETARTFRLLGLHPGPDFDPYAAAALADVSLELAGRALGQLARANLVHPTVPGRYAIHDLLRAYAIHLTTTDDRDAEPNAALTRLFDYYLATAAAAMDTLYPAEAHRRPRIPTHATTAPAVAGSRSALAWLDTELPNLVAAAHTTAQSLPINAIRLSSILYRYLEGGRYPEGLAIHSYARQAAEQTGDQIGQAHALRLLGSAYGRVGRYGLAIEHHRQALVRFQRVGDQSGEAMALNGLGTAERCLGRYRSAVNNHERALALFQQSDDSAGEANALTNLSIVELRLGRHGPAADHLQQALNLYRKVGNLHGEAAVLTNLGNIEERLDCYDAAADYHRQALELLQELGNVQGEAIVLKSLGIVHVSLDQPEQAIEHLERALVLYRQIGDRAGEAYALNGLGEANSLACKAADAISLHLAALQLAKETDIRDQQARAHTGLGQVHHRLGNPICAHAHYERALAIYTALEMPEAEDVRARLAEIAENAGG